jgi:crotonobetainyl-CoA:carnitine CoA-transferase CaiB-like acyl-CoA transferase
LTAAYQSSDGKLFLLVLIDPDVEFPRLCALLGQPELAASELFLDNRAREENAAALYAILRSQFESRELGEWATLFRRNDIKFAPVPTLDDAVKDPQMRAAEAIVEFDYPGVGRIETVSSPVFVNGTPKRTPSPAPDIGANTREILQELGYQGAELDALLRTAAKVKAGAP